MNNLLIPYWFCADSIVLLAVDDTLDSILGGEDDEAEEDAVISQVLDEIGIDVQSKVNMSVGNVCAWGKISTHARGKLSAQGKI